MNLVTYQSGNNNTDDTGHNDENDVNDANDRGSKLNILSLMDISSLSIQTKAYLLNPTKIRCKTENDEFMDCDEISVPNKNEKIYMV